MCGHCGCHGIDVIGDLVDEHTSLLDDAAALRAALARGDRVRAHDVLGRLVDHLASHVRREEDGIFTALRDDGDFAAEVDALEGEHRDLDDAVAGLDVSDPGRDPAVLGLLEQLAEHIEREDLGVFPVAAVTLGRSGWETVERSHDRTPSFLDPRRT